MKTWAERDVQRTKASTPSITNTTNNNTTVYGNGKSTKATSTKTSKSTGLNTRMDFGLAAIHQAIACR